MALTESGSLCHVHVMATDPHAKFSPGLQFPVWIPADGKDKVIEGMSSPSPQPATCDLCEAARMTTWYYEDDLCWIAECEFCAVPMVVLRQHDPSPIDEVKQVLHAQLEEVVAEHFGYDHWIDDNMRNVPDHYHAHARRRGGTSR